MTMRVRDYNCVRGDVAGDTSSSGGACLFTSNLYPTFKRAKALARKIRRQSQRESWIQYVSSITSSTTSQQLWRKVKAANGLYRDFTIPILETSTAIYSSPVDVANLIGQTFASVPSSDSYSPTFQATKNCLERTPINFRCRQPLPYNCDFDMWEMKRALSSAHNTSPGPDGISYELLHHLNEDSLASFYVDDLQISCEGSDMRMVERQLQTAVNNIVKWCDTNGHSISASKSCCVHFCRKRGIHPDPEIRIRDVQIPVAPDVRFLGVIFDHRLTFLPHILQLRKRCEKSLNLLKVLSNTSLGLIEHHYSECIRQSYSLALTTDVLCTDQRANLL
ncbi:RNase H domain-containing protein [Trichonephila clavipes]|nr:RNase H domain-containing protein [Trichonephila clavipes]